MMPTMDPTPDDASKVAAIRALLPATGAGIYLATATAGPFPAETDRALAEADAWELRVGRAGPDRADDREQRSDEARAVVAAVLGADPARIVLGPGAASLAAAFASSLPHRQGERVVLVGAVADPMRRVIRAAAVARGAEFVELPIPEDAVGTDLTIGSSDALVVLSLVDPGTGAVPAVEVLAARAHAMGAAVLVDASLAVGAMPVSPTALGVDALIVEGQRWLLGPEGTAVLWVGAATDATSMHLMRDSIDVLPRRSLLGLARSVGWLLMIVGLPWALARTRLMTSLLLDGLADLERVELHTPPARSCASAVFRIRGWSAQQAIEQLGSRVFAILDETADGEALLASAGAWTTEEELDRFLAAVAELAAHTPENLPRRPNLVVLASGLGEPVT